MRKRLAIKLFNSNRLYLIPNKILNKLIKLENHKRISAGAYLYFKNKGKKYSTKTVKEIYNMLQLYKSLLAGNVSNNTNQGLEGLISQYNITKG